MRIKKNQLIITFGTTTAALAFEAFAAANAIPGRLIPLPSEISAGCGLAWKTEPSQKDELVKLSNKNALSWETMCELEMY